MNLKPIDVTRCDTCGADRGGVVDLASDTPSFKCFACASGEGPWRLAVGGSPAVTIDVRRVNSVTGAMSAASAPPSSSVLTVKPLRPNRMDQVREAHPLSTRELSVRNGHIETASGKRIGPITEPNGPF